MSNTRYKSNEQAVKLGTAQLFAGGTAGAIEIVLMHPLDVVTTRYQSHSLLSADSYSSYASCFKAVRSEGSLAFYKGIVPQLLSEPSKRAAKFFSFERFKDLLYEKNYPAAQVYPLAGFLAGCIEAIIVNPFETIKLRQEAEKAKYSNSQSTFKTAKALYKNGGLGMGGLNKGITATICRNGLWNMCYFGFYHNIKEYLERHHKDTVTLPVKFMVGFAAGSIASVASIPFDVVKTRQGYLPEAGKRKYRRCFQTLFLVAYEEGILALYRGLTTKILRLGTGGAIMLLVYEHMYQFLHGFDD